MEPKDTKEMMTAGADMAVITYIAQRDSRKPDGGLDIQKFAQSIAAQVMVNPQVVNDLKLAFDNAQGIPAEMKNMTLVDWVSLVAFAGQLAAKSLDEIKKK